MAPPRAPAGLSRRARRLWRDVVEGWELDTDSLAVLESACRAWTRMEAAEDAVERDGLTVAGSRGQPVQHPLLPVVDRERAAALAALKQLGLETAEESAGPPPRDTQGRYRPRNVVDLGRRRAG